MQQNPNAMQNQQRQAGREIRSEDLQKMLDMIERLAQNGANDAAQELLQQLEDILRNMQAGIRSRWIISRAARWARCSMSCPNSCAASSNSWMTPSACLNRAWKAKWVT